MAHRGGRRDPQGRSIGLFSAWFDLIDELDALVKRAVNERGIHLVEVSIGVQWFAEEFEMQTVMNYRLVGRENALFDTEAGVDGRSAAGDE